MLPESTVVIDDPSACLCIRTSQRIVSAYAYLCFSVNTVLHISLRDSDVANLTWPFSAQPVICRTLPFSHAYE